MVPGTLKVRERGKKGYMLNNGFELVVEVDGRRIPEYGHKGRTYIEGRKFHRYQLKFRNNRAERVLVVPTVDGLSVVDGNPYHFDSSGYVVQAYSSVTISGWRTSLTEVRGFEFSDKSGSYSGKTVGQQNCGVIGALVYAELKPQPTEIHYHHWIAAPIQVVPPSTPSYPTITWQSTPTWTTKIDNSSGVAGTVGPSGPIGTSFQNQLSAKLMASEPSESIMYCASASNSAPDFNLGTAFGAPIPDRVNEVDFKRGLCLATFEIHYSDRDGLMKDGIQVDKAPELATFPQAFGGFCKPPA